uniref:B30.2/SPRY domain-containing protein n=1 Tax=Labrus bergylta TaxID=56723 RepID=A0A3Q3FQ86_9LABR
MCEGHADLWRCSARQIRCVCVSAALNQITSFTVLFLDGVEKQLESELMRIQQYAVDITLDPDTAHPFLILSDDGKQVYYGKRKNRPDNPERFSEASVLGKQSICAGKFYFEVEVKNKSKWDLGVARGLKTGPWFLMLRNGGEYKAVVLLSLKSKPQKVGVFVDYEEGVVSFYDVDAAALIYSFTGCNFTEKLFPSSYANKCEICSTPKENPDVVLIRDKSTVCIREVSLMYCFPQCKGFIDIGI